MVAHTATTPAPRATDALRVSAPSPHSTPPRSARLDDSTPDTLSSLLPPPTLTDEILDDLAVPQFSLSIVAMKNGLTHSGMLTWLNLPETREVLALRESAAYAHARHVAALNIGHAVETVASIVRDYNTTRPAREAQDRKTPGFAHRAATNARKAAWLLLQFARIVPVNESDLRRAGGYISRPHRTANVSERTPVSHRTPSVSEGMSDTLKGSVSERMTSDSDGRATGCLPTSAKRDNARPSHRTASVNERISPDSDSRATGCVVGGPTSAKRNPPSHRTASVNERTSSSDSPLPSQRVHPAGALPPLPPASALKDDADSADADSADADSADADFSEALRVDSSSEFALVATGPPDTT